MWYEGNLTVFFLGGALDTEVSKCHLDVAQVLGSMKDVVLQPHILETKLYEYMVGPVTLPGRPASRALCRASLCWWSVWGPSELHLSLRRLFLNVVSQQVLRLVYLF